MADRPQGKTVESLEVRLGDVPVGQIVRAAGGYNAFLFGQAYAEMQRRPTLSLSFQSSSGALWAPTRGYPGRLPPFFANLLPEGELRGLLARRAGVNPRDEFALLGALGADLPGAVEVLPASGSEAARFSASRTEMTESVATLAILVGGRPAQVVRHSPC